MTSKEAMTNKEARNILQEQIDRYGEEYDAEGIEALDMAIKALEQEDVLEKIRTEILENRQWHMEHGQEDCAMLLDLEALAIIDKYKAESEDAE